MTDFIKRVIFFFVITGKLLRQLCMSDIVLCNIMGIDFTRNNIHTVTGTTKGTPRAVVDAYDEAVRQELFERLDLIMKELSDEKVD